MDLDIYKVRPFGTLIIYFDIIISMHDRWTKRQPRPDAEVLL